VSYRLRLSRRALRQLEKLPLEIRLRIDPRLRSLSTEPRPAGCRKLAGIAHGYRLRIGPGRVIYEVDDQRREVRVEWIGPRASAY